MKIKITRSDGTVVELEGDAAELQAMIPHVLPFPFVFNPLVTLPALQPLPQPQPFMPHGPNYWFGQTTGVGGSGGNT